MLVSLNGVLQAPGSSYTVSGSTITFASNLVTGDVIDFIHILGSVLDLGVPSDSTVSLAKLTATGTKDATTFLRGDNTFAAAGSPSITDNGNATAITINSSEQVEFTDGTASLPSITNSGDVNTGLLFPSDDTIGFSTGGTERMRIRSDGMVAIGTTGGSAQIQVLLNSGDIAYFQNAAGTGAKITAGNQSFSAVSDENKKENITELNKQESYDNIKNIKAITYNFKDVIKTDEDGNTITYKDDKNRIGFIAQDWETNYSQLVNTDEDGVKSLLYTETTPVLLSALQKAQEKIELLESRITELENGS